MKRIINDISNGRNIETNLKKYVSGMKAYHHKYAMVRLALVYYTYYQIEIDENTRRESHSDIKSAVNVIIRDALLGDKTDKDSAVRIIEENRRILLEEVGALTHYVDAFKLYEYALNRVEYRFRSDDYPYGYSDEDICKKLMQYILSDEDNVVINTKITEVLAELPIRLTRNKFFEFVSNGLSIYKGSEKQTLDDFVYMIKTSAMLDEEDKYKAAFPELEDALNEFRQTDFAGIEEEEYKMLSRTLEDASTYMEDIMNVSMMMMEVMNGVYAAIMSSEHKETDRVVETCVRICEAVNDYFILGSEIDEETEDMFVMLEGEQENAYSKINLYDITEQIKGTYGPEIERQGLSDGIKELDRLAMLSSDSIFVDVDAVCDDTIVDDETLKEVEASLINEFDALFKRSGKSIKRAVMSSVIAQLPVFFNNISELQDFIYNSLSGCTDRAEKLACIEVLNQIMEE